MKRLLIGLFILLYGGTLSAMSLKTEVVTNAPLKFVETYQVGLMLFENKANNTNLHFLSISIPLMLKEDLKM